jgi:hypothetical protein
MATSKSNWDQLYRELSVQNTLTKFQLNSTVGSKIQSVFVKMIIRLV